MTGDFRRERTVGRLEAVNVEVDRLFVLCGTIAPGAIVYRDRRMASYQDSAYIYRNYANPANHQSPNLQLGE